MSLSISVPCVDIPPPMRPVSGGGYAANSVTDPRQLNCKSRVPDIQMINRYYGLVPKKFLINRRADSKSLRSQVDFSVKEQAVSETLRNNRQKFLRSASVEAGKNVKNGRDSSSGGHRILRPATTNGRGRETNNNNNNGQEQYRGELIAQKMKVSSHHNNVNRRKDFRGRSNSLCENFYDLDHPFDCSVCSYGFGSAFGESCQGDQDSGEGSPTPPEPPHVQRVIKINLHSMKWEESFNVLQGGKNAKCEKRRPMRKWASVEEEDNSRKNSSSSAGKEAGFSVPVKGETKSFEVAPKPCVAPIIKLRAKSAKPPPSESAAERRRKFGAYKKTLSLSLAQGESKGESDEEGDEDDPFPKSILLRHSLLRSAAASATSASPPHPGVPPGSESIKNALHVQQPAEVRTMISAIAPSSEGASSKQDTTAAMTQDLLTNIIRMTNGLLSSSGDGEEDPESNDASLSKETLAEKPVASPSSPLPSPVSYSSTPIEPTASPPVTYYGRQEKGGHYRHNVPPLRKAASISCEQEETFPALAPGSHHDPKPRCKTAKVRGSVSFAKTASMKFIPARIRSNVVVDSCVEGGGGVLPLKQFEKSKKEEMDLTPPPPAALYHISRPLSSSTPSRASKNRRLLLKKALAELNQASASLNKKLRSQPHQLQQRPRTAPSQQQGKTLDKGGRRHGGGSLDEKKKADGGDQEDKPVEPVKRRPISRQQSITFMENLFGSTSSLKGVGVGGEDPPVPAASRSLEEGLEKANKRLEKPPMLSSGKREECMRIYEKMKKKGCTVSLETIFRGMMTPSEYRVFMESLEKEEEKEDEDPVEEVKAV